MLDNIIDENQIESTSADITFDMNIVVSYFIAFFLIQNLVAQMVLVC